jgi:hypothetical protein
MARIMRLAGIKILLYLAPGAGAGTRLAIARNTEPDQVQRFRATARNAVDPDLSLLP